MKIVIIGHKNPDTDSVVAALSYANLKNQIDPKNKYIPAVAGNINNETRFVLGYLPIPAPKSIEKIYQRENEIIVIDHTEEGQLPSEVVENKIIEVIDHHRLGGMQTTYPIFARIEPIGSTSTIIAKIFRETKIIPSQEIAGLLLSGIISDTLFLKSPTTTDDDRKIIFELNKISQISNLGNYASKMFEAKSDISDIPISEVIIKDYKEFQFGKNKVGIGVWETVKPEGVLKFTKQIIQKLKKLKANNKLDLIYFLVIDILEQRSDMLIISKQEQEIAEKAFGMKTKGDILPLENVVARKQQVVPLLEKFLR